MNLTNGFVVLGLTAVSLVNSGCNKVDRIPPSSKSSETVSPSAQIARSLKPLPATGYKVIPATTPSKEKPEAKPQAAPFRIVGTGTTAKVLDDQGHIVFEGTPSVHILSGSASPQKKLVLIEAANGVNLLLDPKTKETAALPVKPPSNNETGFGPWFWLDDTKLLGVSARPRQRRPGETAAEAESQPVEKTLLYVFDINSKTLRKVDMELRSMPPVFEVLEVRTDGYVKLLNPEGSTGKDTEWGKIDLTLP